MKELTIALSVITVLGAVMLFGGHGLSKSVQRWEISEVFLFAAFALFIILGATCLIGGMMAMNDRHEIEMAKIKMEAK